MHQVLQRTRPAPADTRRPSSRLRTFLRSFLVGKRGLVLLALVGGTAISSQALHGLLNPASKPAPGTPAGSEGREESASAIKPGAKSAAAAPAQVAAAPSAEEARGRAAVLAISVAGSPQRSRAAVLPPSGGTLDAPATPRAASHRAPVRRESAGEARQVVLAETQVVSSARPAPVAEPPLPSVPPVVANGKAGTSQRDSGSLAELNPFEGVACSDATAALPTDTPPEEAWLPGSDASSAVNSAAVDSFPVPPIFSESPELAAAPSSPSLHANRNSSCLLKQPAGRN